MGIGATRKGQAANTLLTLWERVCLNRPSAGFGYEATTPPLFQAGEGITVHPQYLPLPWRLPVSPRATGNERTGHSTNGHAWTKAIQWHTARLCKIEYRAMPIDPCHLLRVRVHLNLAEPNQGECAVRAQATSGAWLAIAYATELLLVNCLPVVNLKAQEKIQSGRARKAPHAFIEGDIIHFKGRHRDKASPALAAMALAHLGARKTFQSDSDAIRQADERISYNPRFARCFYRNEIERSAIELKLESCQAMAVIGWNFWAKAPTFTPMADGDYCETPALARASTAEKISMQRSR